MTRIVAFTGVAAALLLCPLLPAQWFDETVEEQTAQIGQGFQQPPAPASGFQEEWGGGPTQGFDAPAQDFFTAAPSVGGTALPSISTISVVEGAWIRDAVSGQLLDVPEMKDVEEGQRVNYSNDGMTMGDAVADDPLWSNVETLESDFIGPSTQTYVLYYINMLRLLHTMDPLAFAAVSVASPDPVSPLPLLDDFENHQDTRVAEWNEIFLREFRQPDPITGEVTPRGEFYPVYVPPPPFYRPIRPDPLLVGPPLEFLEESWVAFQGGVPNAQRLQHLGDQQRGGQGRGFQGGASTPGAAGFQGGELIGGSAAREWDGRSTYFGEGGAEQTEGAAHAF